MYIELGNQFVGDINTDRGILSSFELKHDEETHAETWTFVWEKSGDAFIMT